MPGAVESTEDVEPSLPDDVVLLLEPPEVEPVVEADLRVRPPEGPERDAPPAPRPDPREDDPREVDEPDPVDEVSSVPVGAVLVEMICDRRRPVAAVVLASVA